MTRRAVLRRSLERLDHRVSTCFLTPSVTWRASEAFPARSQFGQLVIYGLRSDKQNAPMPAAAVPVLNGQNLSLSGFNLGINQHRVPSILEDLFKLLIDGSLKVEVTKYPSADASSVHTLFEHRKATGKLVLVP